MPEAQFRLSLAGLSGGPDPRRQSARPTRGGSGESGRAGRHCRRTAPHTHRSGGVCGRTGGAAEDGAGDETASDPGSQVCQPLLPGGSVAPVSGRSVRTRTGLDLSGRAPWITDQRMQKGTGLAPLSIFIDNPLRETVIERGAMITMRIVLAHALAGVMSIALSAIAQAQPVTKAQQDAIRAQCRSDFIANCSAVPRGGREAFLCLEQNKAKLSGGCKSAVEAVVAATTPKPPAASKPVASKPAAPPVEAEPQPNAAPAQKPLAAVPAPVAPSPAKPATKPVPAPKAAAAPVRPATPPPAIAAAPAAVSPPALLPNASQRLARLS